MLAACRRRYTEARFEPRTTLVERARGDDEMIELPLQSSVIPSSAMTFFTDGRASTRSINTV